MPLPLWNCQEVQKGKRDDVPPPEDSKLYNRVAIWTFQRSSWTSCENSGENMSSLPECDAFAAIWLYQITFKSNAFACLMSLMKLSQKVDASSQKVDASSRKVNASLQKVDASLQKVKASSQIVEALSWKVKTMSRKVKATSQKVEATLHKVEATSR